MSEDNTNEKDALKILVESLDIIPKTDIISCYTSKGHKKHVVACLVNCDRIKNKISRCRPLTVYLNRLLNNLSQGKEGLEGKKEEEGSFTHERVGSDAKPINKLPSRKTRKKIEAPDKNRKHEKVDLKGGGEKLHKSIIGKKVFEPVQKNTNKSSISKSRKK